MKTSIRSLAAVAALSLLAASAGAQLKPKAGAGGLAAPAAAPAPAAPAAAPANKPAGGEKEEAGKLAANGWLLLLDRKDWGSAWDLSSGVFRKNVPLGTWMDNIPKVREPLGALTERTPQESVYKTTLPGYPDGEYVSVRYASKFANKADAEELVTTVREPDGRWRVTGYQVR
jgi:hypothetical protein